jgi:predicted Fe-Mo cluster-binding NifX family protein
MNYKVAISIWKNRVSPVMDSANRILSIDYFDGNEIGRKISSIPQLNDIHKAEFFKSQQIKILICGAISIRMHQILTASHIEIIPFIRGSIDQVIDAFNKGELQNGNFFLPGCGQHLYGATRQRCRRWGNSRK